MLVRSIVSRLNLWRLWRNPAGRRLYGTLQRAGFVLALMIRYETTPVTDGGPPAVPAAFTLQRWRGDETLPESVPGSLEPTDVVVGATIDDELVGYCVLSPRSVLVSEIGAVLEPAGVYLWDLYVKPAYRGRGLGTALLHCARNDDLAVATGTVEALVAADNEPSRRAFRAAGFAPTERLFSIGWGEQTYQRRRVLDSAPER